MTLHVDISNPKEVRPGPGRAPPAAGSPPASSPPVGSPGGLQRQGTLSRQSVGGVDRAASFRMRAPQNLFEAATRGDEEWVSRHVECDVGARARARSALSSGGAVR